MRLQLKQGRLLTRTLPVFVWLGAIASVVFLFQHQSMRTELKGIAFSHEQSINSVETGYIRSIPVTLYQQVKKGDTLAIIKENTVAKGEYIDALLQAQRDTAEAELEQLKADLEAAENRLVIEGFEHTNDIVSTERRLSVDVERARLAVLEINSSLEPDRLALKDLEVEIEIVNSLLKQNAAEEYELQKAQAQHSILKETVLQTEQLLAQAQKDYEAALLRKDEFGQKVPMRPQLANIELAPIRKAILVQERKIAELIEQRDVIVLTAPFDGIVNTLSYKPGQTVVRGDAIMTIVKPTPEVITTWASQREMGSIELNMKVKIASLNPPYHTFVSQVSHISASMEMIPERLWKDPVVPEWGRAVQIPLQPGFACIHNEIIGISTVVQ
ncbi:MAG: HlyD family efflux transporter periplasmic adaptor subunit [Planctomycetes bacterium]|nr:HlyD family efflux transporter periplasmic adaptor subunit [Planctomycetota bacterium]